MPWLSHIAPAANMRIRENKAAVEQTKTIRVKAQREGIAVRTVTVDVQRVGAVALLVFAVDDGDLNPRPVRGSGEQSLRAVKRAIKPSRYFQFFQQRGLTANHVVFID